MGAEAKPPEYCFFWIDHWSACMTKAEWSGWVQAIGAIAAIASGVLVVWWQLHRQQRLTREDVIRRLQIISTSAFFVAVSLILFSRAVKLGKFNNSELTEIRSRMKALAGIPLLEVPQVEVSNAIGSAVSTFLLLERALSDNENFVGTDYSLYQAWDKKRCFEAEKWANALLIHIEHLEVASGTALVDRSIPYPNLPYSVDGEVIYRYPFPN